MTIYDPLAKALGIEPIENPSYLRPISKEELSLLGLEKIPGPKHCDETKQLIAESNKQYYRTEEGIERRKKVSERNSLIKSDEMKRRWKQDYERLRELTKSGGRKKGTKETKPRRPKNNIRHITDGYRVFNDAYEAALYHDIHPVNIRRRCRHKIDGWRYM